MKMTYQQALAEGDRVGASRCSATAHLAQICRTLAFVHAINPELVFNGAMKKGLNAKQVAKLANDDPVVFGNLMFA
jgi:hypothetical protein